MAASVNPNGAATAYWFQFGTNTSYGSFTSTNNLAAGSSPVTVPSQINGLLQGTVYHYQIVATNIVGANFGADTTFTTLAVTPPQLGAATLINGSLRFLFTNAPGASFSAHATNNLTAPRPWPFIESVVESPVGSGQYQFTDPNPATNAQLFYYLSQP